MGEGEEVGAAGVGGEVGAGGELAEEGGVGGGHFGGGEDGGAEAADELAVGGQDGGADAGGVGESVGFVPFSLGCGAVADEVGAEVVSHDEGEAAVALVSVGVGEGVVAL